MTAANCAALSGVYQGNGTTCQDVTCGGPGGVGSQACGEAQQACRDAITPDNFKNKGKKVRACAHAANWYLDNGLIDDDCDSCIVSAVASKKKEGTNCGPACCVYPNGLGYEKPCCEPLTSDPNCEGFGGGTPDYDCECGITFPQTCG